MKLLIDENLSPRLCKLLVSAGYDAVHASEVTGSGASDQAILAHAADHGLVIVTADTDFGALLAQTKTNKPSVVLVRALLSLPMLDQGHILVANLEPLSGALGAGAIVVVTSSDIRVRPLPLA